MKRKVSITDPIIGGLNKTAWLNYAQTLVDKAGYSPYDQGVWVNLHMLHSQGLTVEAAVAKLPELLTRLTKHTPGPWSAYFYPGEPITGAIQPGRRQDEWRIEPPPDDRSNGFAIVASVHGPNMERNAWLIAAAPDLLEACKEMIRMYKAVQPAGGWQGVYDQATDAITKAMKG